MLKALLHSYCEYCIIMYCMWDNIYLQRYLCGIDPICSKACDSKEALTRTFSNIEKYYTVVGLLEEREASLEYISWKYPQFFQGYKEFTGIHLNQKAVILEKRKDDDSFLRRLFCQKYAHECTLHEFIKKRFHNQYQNMLHTKI